jgi:hypothetical protein
MRKIQMICDRCSTVVAEQNARIGEEIIRFPITRTYGIWELCVHCSIDVDKAMSKMKKPKICSTAS